MRILCEADEERFCFCEIGIKPVRSTILLRVPRTDPEIDLLIEFWCSLFEEFACLGEFLLRSPEDSI